MITSTESQQNLELCLNFFKSSLQYPDIINGGKLYLFVDKDLNAIEVLKRVFPTALIYLDWVHIDRYFHDRVFPGSYFSDSDVIEKKVLYELVRKCKVSHTVEEYERNKGILLRETEKLMVKPKGTKKFIPFETYFLKN